jgi:hypothetical protein
MSAMCHKRTSATSFDHLVSSREQRRRDGQAERLGGLKVDDKFGVVSLIDGKVGRGSTL